MNTTRLVALFVGSLTAPLLATSARYPGLSPHALTLDVPATLLEHVRQTMEPFKDIERAVAAGYSQFLGCVSDPQQGPTQWRVVNASYISDGEVDAEHPEALLYESDHGEGVLAGVEYVVFADAWLAHHPEPPVLEGQLFQYVDSPNRDGLPPYYQLQVWAWRDNPIGTFVGRGEQASCDGL
jgi:hypothetical protein